MPSLVQIGEFESETALSADSSQETTARSTPLRVAVQDNNVMSRGEPEDRVVPYDPFADALAVP